MVSHYLYLENEGDRPDIYTFQETHSIPEEDWSSSFGKTGTNVLFSHGASNSRGVLLGFSEYLDFSVVSSEIDSEGHYIVAHVKIQGEPLTIMALYLEPQLTNAKVTDLLATVMEQIALGGNTRVLMCGDFNAILDDSLDLGVGTEGRSIKSRGKRLANYMELHHLTDIWRVGHPDAKRFTSFGTSRLTRIDLAFTSPAMLSHVVDSEIGISYGSDHSPVWVEFSLTQEK